MLTPDRLNTFVLSGFAGVALLIAVVGVAGVLAFSVSARTREFGVRLAVGSSPRHLLRARPVGRGTHRNGRCHRRRRGRLPFVGVAASYLRERAFAGRIANRRRGGRPRRRRPSRLTDAGRESVTRRCPAGAQVGVSAMQTHAIVPVILPVHILAGALGTRVRLCRALCHEGSHAASQDRNALRLRDGRDVAEWCADGIPQQPEDFGQRRGGPGDVLFRDDGVAHGAASPSGSLNGSMRSRMVFGLTVAVLAFRVRFRDVEGRQTGDSSLLHLRHRDAARGDGRHSHDSAEGASRGRRRIARHLWRMCFAMWIAAASFFWGPPRRVPELIRIPALQAVAVLVPIVVMLYWLWRVRTRRTFPGTVVALNVAKG